MNRIQPLAAAPARTLEDRICAFVTGGILAMDLYAIAIIIGRDLHVRHALAVLGLLP